MRFIVGSLDKKIVNGVGTVLLLFSRAFALQTHCSTSGLTMYLFRCGSLLIKSLLIIFLHQCISTLIESMGTFPKFQFDCDILSSSWLLFSRSMKPVNVASAILARYAVCGRPAICSAPLIPYSNQLYRMCAADCPTLPRGSTEDLIT